VTLQCLWRKKWYLQASILSVTSSAMISAAKNMYNGGNTQLTQNWKTMNLTVPKWIRATYHSQQTTVCMCVIKWIPRERLSHDNQGIWWGLVWIPNYTKVQVLVLIVWQEPTETHTVEIKGQCNSENELKVEVCQRNARCCKSQERR
jgi:hypothetical protein